MTRTVVANRRLVTGMIKAGLVIEHDDYKLKKVRHWSGSMVPVYYVSGVAEGVREPFEFRGRQYELKFFAGCFAPFIIDVQAAEDLAVRHKKLIA